MRLTAIVLVFALTLAACAAAGLNPDAAVFVDFDGMQSDPSGVVHEVYPVPYAPLSAYFGICGTNEFEAVCMRVSLTPGAFTVMNWESLVSDIIVEIWNPEDGVLIAADECRYDDFIYVMRADLLWTGAPGDITIADHPDCARMVYDCQGGTDSYCVWMHGAVGKSALTGDPGCDPSVPVKASTWGLMKALYR